LKSFFISYTGKDEPWAEWIAAQLELAGYTTVLQAWDFPPGSSFVVEMQKAAAGSERTLAVLSPDYLQSVYGLAEWAAAFADDPTGEKRKLVPVQVRKTDPKGLLKPIVHIDLVGLDEAAARERLLAGLAPDRGPATPPPFPGNRPAFPGDVAASIDPEESAARLAALPLDEIPEPGALPPGSRMPLSRNPLFAGGVFWLSFGDPTSVQAEVIACGRRLAGPDYDEWPLERQVRWLEDVWPYYERALAIFEARLGPDHPDTKVVRGNLASIPRELGGWQG